MHHGRIPCACALSYSSHLANDENWILNLRPAAHSTRLKQAYSGRRLATAERDIRCHAMQIFAIRRRMIAHYRPILRQLLTNTPFCYVLLKNPRSVETTSVHIPTAVAHYTQGSTSNINIRIPPSLPTMRCRSVKSSSDHRSKRSLIMPLES